MPIPSVVSRLSRLASVALFVLLSLFLVWFGSVYLGAGDYLSFHAAAVPEGAHDAGRPLYLALMNLVGSASLSLGAAGGFLALGAIRQGELAAIGVVTGAYVFAFGAAAVTAEELAAATGSPTSWHVMGGLITATLIAAGFGLAAGCGHVERVSG